MKTPEITKEHPLYKKYCEALSITMDMRSTPNPFVVDCIKISEEYAYQFKQSPLPIEGEVKDAFMKIKSMIIEYGETDYKYAFNRCWHIATDILNKIEQTKPSSKEVEDISTNPDHKILLDYTTSSTVKEEETAKKWEKEAEELYPLMNVSPENEYLNDSILDERAAHIKACQMHCNDGLGEGNKTGWVVINHDPNQTRQLIYAGSVYAGAIYSTEENARRMGGDKEGKYPIIKIKWNETPTK